MRVNVADEVGPNCVTVDDGEHILALIQPELDNARQVRLDFAGVQVIASPFFNAAIGRLLSSMSEKELRERVVFDALPPAAAHVLERVIANSAEYYANPDQQNALDEIFADGGDD